MQLFVKLVNVNTTFYIDVDDDDSGKNIVEKVVIELSNRFEDVSITNPPFKYLVYNGHRITDDLLFKDIYTPKFVNLHIVPGCNNGKAVKWRPKTDSVKENVPTVPLVTNNEEKHPTLSLEKTENTNLSQAIQEEPKDVKGFIEKNNVYIQAIKKERERLLTRFNHTKKVNRIDEALKEIEKYAATQDVTNNVKMYKALTTHRIGFFGKTQTYHNIKQQMETFSPEKKSQMGA